MNHILVHFSVYSCLSSNWQRLFDSCLWGLTHVSLSIRLFFPWCCDGLFFCLSTSCIYKKTVKISFWNNTLKPLGFNYSPPQATVDKKSCLFCWSQPSEGWKNSRTLFQRDSFKVNVCFKLRYPYFPSLFCSFSTTFYQTEAILMGPDTAWGPSTHPEHRFHALSSKLCQNWWHHRWGTLYLRAAVHRRCQHPPKDSGINKTVKETE